MKLSFCRLLSLIFVHITQITVIVRESFLLLANRFLSAVFTETRTEHYIDTELGKNVYHKLTTFGWGVGDGIHKKVYKLFVFIRNTARTHAQNEKNKRNTNTRLDESFLCSLASLNKKKLFFFLYSINNNSYWVDPKQGYKCSESFSIIFEIIF